MSNLPSSSPVTVGILGGGQLAWMMAQEASRLGVKIVVQTPNSLDPAVHLADDVILASLGEIAATRELARECDVVTFENEFVDLEGLRPLEEDGVCFYPRLDAIAPLLDKLDQRNYLKNIGLPIPQYKALDPQTPITSPYGFPVVLKARRQGYDGKGTFIIKSQEELEAFWNAHKQPSLLIEELIPFERELAVMAARSVSGEVVIYPVVETEQEKQVCHRVNIPARISPHTEQQIRQFATTLLEKLDVVGIYGIEFFITPDQQVLVNEIAPRTHNSGHYSLDACETSQFAMQLQAISNLPLGSPQLICEGAVMVNLLGFEHARSEYIAQRQKLENLPRTFVHWYGKTEARPGRKLGHVTVLLDSVEEANQISQQVEKIWYGVD
ncbi:5-(carboxyamino)imidazole ribonucleotide synthase [Spirulina sp. CS-785/01]|uniref:5-(carboxyamino)imidazole ribonucleotide synthase n=1 Tax=Spirulina sp. CS-785/01 TaxID=3021716 RepID=UPI00232B6AA8|nr:5-(carboxyamino)imidazole ribonucleotide synthase [Spirulina sp. CS-785/01]